MKIVRLEANDVLRLTAVKIDPEGNVVCIGGDNEQGKTSVLNCIEMALGGENSIPPKPIRNGQSKGWIAVDLGDFVVERTFTEKGSALSVKSKDGAKYPSPQAMLNKLVGQLSFDPLAFKNMEPKKQRETLQALVAIDPAPLEANRKAAFDRRTEVNRRAKDMKARLDAMLQYDGVPEAEESVADLVKELNRRQDVNRGNSELRDEAADAQDAVDDCQRRIELAEKALKEERARLIELQKDATDAQGMADKAADANVAEIEERIGQAEETNRKVRENAKRAELAKALADEIASAAKLTGEIEQAEADKMKLLSEAKFPVEGLAFDENGVTFGGIPFEQCSGAQAIRVSVAMGLAMNPKLPVLLIRDGSLLGEKNLRLIAEMAAEHGAQVWIERVGEGKECQVIIEDGHVKEVRKPELMTAGA